MGGGRSGSWGRPSLQRYAVFSSFSLSFAREVANSRRRSSTPPVCASYTTTASRYTRANPDLRPRPAATPTHHRSRPGPVDRRAATPSRRLASSRSLAVYRIVSPTAATSDPASTYRPARERVV
ncbi:hypothetical protein FS749_003160 [Ceratobasidium sp. UAMH 11750]|nr:hypothetical protein FS749_003160 [Ceratobasidium sp. UAMH 11750]